MQSHEKLRQTHFASYLWGSLTEILTLGQLLLFPLQQWLTKQSVLTFLAELSLLLNWCSQTKWGNPQVWVKEGRISQEMSKTEIGIGILACCAQCSSHSIDAPPHWNHALFRNKHWEDTRDDALISKGLAVSAGSAYTPVLKHETV